MTEHPEDIIDPSRIIHPLRDTYDFVYDPREQYFSTTLTGDSADKAMASLNRYGFVLLKVKKV